LSFTFSNQHPPHLAAGYTGVINLRYLYERKGEVLYIGKGKPIFNRVKSHYIESYREVGGDTKDKKWHRFFSKYNGPITVYISEIEREVDRRIVEMILQKFNGTAPVMACPIYGLKGAPERGFRIYEALVISCPRCGNPQAH
jgi:hypothetical protein